ncbi:hypothetical protein A3I56_02485 [Candidatus Roizmanbacteria bacterium RIFCSPLOWO2_02_FULL_43_10]|uniref:Uncharacterized protein n=1 Tax=Candidatus Roizmanbacteria bacterium RIFCSPLOWO2_02_FULL_43_10 TaxID=1802078 RepID=A0A1F7JUQ6_9BACT|nr:MAG: hypothetical protein A3I56_02485 [Candidatus Roizmanbacteria bacterium RIFCSPLOWO2_02_FULL_43_10]
MKFILSIVICVIFLANTLPVFAGTTPTPTQAPQVQYTNEFTVDNQPSAVVELLKNFIEGFDSFIGGFIFYTPNPLGDKIILKDKSEIPGITKYRDMFYHIALPVLAIVIAGIAVTKLGSDNAQDLKNFAVRFLITVILFITVPPVLSYSIQANNLLVDKIASTQKFTTFLDDYLDKTQTGIQNNESSEKFGIPSFDISLKAGIFKSLGKFIVQIFLFILTFIFLLLGFVYLGFQFVIRFAALLFLGVIYPIVIPFMLSERTQQIPMTFFKSWFTFLIQQPAFVLGFSIATDIFNSILTAKGPSVGMLFFYTGFLFFLGGVNILVARIFGDTWTAFSTNMAAAVGSRSVTSPVQSRMSNFKRGLVGGNGSVSTLMGEKIRNEFNKKRSGDNDPGGSNGSTKPNGGSSYTYSSRGSSSNGNSYQEGGGLYTMKTPDKRPRLSQGLSQRGMGVEMENYKQGVVSVSGEAYKYDDSKNGLTSYYPTRSDAIRDGIQESQLQKVTLDQDKFIDLSTFTKDHPNPHNFNAMQEAKRKGKDIDYAYVNESSPPQKVQQFLEMSQSRNEAYGIKGVVVRRQGKNSSDHIIRLYSPNTKTKK